MSILSVEELAAELPGVRIGPTSHPSEDQVERFIADIEAEVRALWQGASCQWPDDGTAQATFAKLTIMLGAQWRVLAAKFTLASTAQTPDAVGQARAAYNDRLKRILQVCTGAETSPATTSTGPLVGVTRQGMVEGSSFGEWTEWHDKSLRRVVRPFRWFGYSGE